MAEVNEGDILAAFNFFSARDAAPDAQAGNPQVVLSAYARHPLITFTGMRYTVYAARLCRNASYGII
jgi:hypothetical protein